MNKQSNEIKWMPVNLLLDQVKKVEKNYGNYKVAVLANGSKVVIDNKNLRALVIDGTYLVAVADFEQWLSKGFIVLQRSYEDKYYVLNAEDGNLVFVGDVLNSYAFLEDKSDYLLVRNDLGYAIFDKNGKQITDWYEGITSYGLAMGQSDYFIVSENGKKAIFDKNGKQVSDWFDKIYLDGLVFGESDYYVVVKNGEYAIFHKDGQQITNWSVEFDFNASNYYKVKNKDKGSIYQEGDEVFRYSDYVMVNRNDKAVLFHKDGYQISDWFDWISTAGLYYGQSDYYLVIRYDKRDSNYNDYQYAIFDKDGNQVSNWFDEIEDEHGLIKGESMYYKAVKGIKYAVFDVKGHRVSNWHDYIWERGLQEYWHDLVVGISDYSILEKDGKYAIFHKNGKQISDWYDWIIPYGLIDGNSGYYFAYNYDKTLQDDGKIVYIGKIGSSKLLGPFKEVIIAEVITDPNITEDVSDSGSSYSILAYTLDNKRLEITRMYLDDFFRGTEEDYENTK
ncbi:MAG: hypothetical protein ACPL1B_10145 [Thermoprotei archaeon]